MSVEITWHYKEAYKRFYGFITNTEFISSIEEIIGDARFDNLRHLTNDFSGITGHNLSYEMLLLYSAYLIGSSHSNPFINITLITPNQVSRQLLSRNLGPEMFDFLNINEMSDISSQPTLVSG